MASDEYTPTVEEAREDWSWYEVGIHDWTRDFAREAFDRMLARVRAEAAAEALDTWTASVREELRATLTAGIDLGEQYMLGMRSALSQADARAAELREKAGQ